MTRRLRCLDGLRGVLATYVMLGHMAPFTWVPVGWSWVPRALSHGQAAVDVFFMLSGLVIVRSLASCGERRDVFLSARFWRIYPVYLPVLALAVGAQALPPAGIVPWAGPEAAGIAGGGWPDDAGARLALHLVMLHGVLPESVLPYVCFAFLGSAWSLSTEWQFYAVMAACPRLHRHAWALSLAFLGMAALALLWRAGASESWQFGRAFLPNKAAWFALGIASAGLFEAWAGAGLRYGIVLAAGLAIATADGDSTKLLPPLVWTGCLLAELGWRPLRAVAWCLTRSLSLWLGAVSYCLYLVNEPLQKLLLMALEGASPAVFDAVWLPGAIGVPLLAAWWLHVAVERPGVRLGRRSVQRLVNVQ